MFNSLLKLIIIFIILSLATFWMGQFFGVPFQDRNYWEDHGIIFLVFLGLFPRLTLLFSSVVSGGLFWWLGWFFVPRFLVAVLATLAFWNQNPGLVCLAWLFAIGGEASEKMVVVRRSQVVRPMRYARPIHQQPEIIDVTPKK